MIVDFGGGQSFARCEWMVELTFLQAYGSFRGSVAGDAVPVPLFLLRLTELPPLTRAFNRRLRRKFRLSRISRVAARWLDAAGSKCSATCSQKGAAEAIVDHSDVEAALAVSS